MLRVSGNHVCRSSQFSAPISLSFDQPGPPCDSRIQTLFQFLVAGYAHMHVPIETVGASDGELDAAAALQI